MAQDLKTESEARLVYADIIRGFSHPTESIFIRHYSELDTCDTEAKRRELESAAKAKNLPSEKEKLELLNQNGHWTTEEEKVYQAAIDDLNGMRYSLKSLLIPQQIEHLNSEINKKIKEIDDKYGDRFQLVGMTRESYANQRASEFHILRSFYKNPELTIPLYSEEEIDALNSKQVRNLINIYHNTHSIYFEKNFKRIAICPFFINAYSMCDGNPTVFFGKPVIQMTVYQQALFSRGSYFQRIREEGAQNPPEEFYDDLDKVIQHYERQWSIILGKRTNNQLPQ